MKRFYLLLLCCVALLTLSACGKTCEVCGKSAHNHICCPPATCESCGATGSCDCTAATSTQQAPSNASGISKQPDIMLSYSDRSGKTVTHALLTGSYSIEVDLGNGMKQMTHADGIRPCHYDGSVRIPLSDLEEYTLHIDLPTKVKSYKLTAYPAAEAKKNDFYGEGGQTEILTNGALHLLKGAYYYELNVTYTDGYAIYGFFAE